MKNLKSTLTKISLLTLTLIWIPQVNAGLHFEPHAYLSWGESAEKNSTNDYSILGHQYGLRLGLYKPRFHLGLEYKTGEIRYENNDSGDKSTVKPHYMGAYLGFYLKQRYGLNFSYYPNIRENSSSSKLGGIGWAVEFVYRFKTHLQFKFGYQHTQLSEDEATGQNLDNKIESKTLLIGIGFPFVL